jgi:glycosyl transferase, family 25
MKVFLINLDRSPDRLAHMQVQARVAGIEFERVPGIDGRTMVEPFLGNTFASYMSPGERGCYASHLLCCQKIIEEGLPYAMILEDDAVLEERTTEIIVNAVKIAPKNWDFIHLSGITRHATQTVGSVGGGRELVYFSRRPPYLATGYLMSAAGALKFLAPLHREVPNDIDVRRQWLFKFNVLGVVPCLVASPGMFQSVAEHDENMETRFRVYERSGRFADWFWRAKQQGLTGTIRNIVRNRLRA